MLMLFLSFDNMKAELVTSIFNRIEYSCNSENLYFLIRKNISMEYCTENHASFTQLK